MFLVALSLCCTAQSFSSYREGDYSLLWWLLTAVASVLGAQALGLRASVVVACKLSSCGTQAWLFRSMGNLPGQGLNLCSLHWKVYSTHCATREVHPMKSVHICHTLFLCFFIAPYKGWNVSLSSRGRRMWRKAWNQALQTQC